MLATNTPTLQQLQESQNFDSLPIFANAENKKLDAEIKENTAKLADLNANIEDNESRINAMLIHMKNIKQELLHTQSVCEARNRSIETEDHLKQIAERQSGRLKNEIKDIESKISTLSDELNQIQNSVYRGNEKIDSLRTELKLGKEELDVWLHVQVEKEEDNIALLNYTKEDDAKIKELTLQIEKYMKDVQKKKNVLSSEITETKVSQIELENATNSFKQLYQERQNLLESWEKTIETMKKCDNDIKDLQAKQEQYKNDIKNKDIIINEKQDFLDLQNENNEKTDQKIQSYDRYLSKAKLELAELQNSYSNFQDEVEILKETLNDTSNKLNGKKTEIGNLRNNIQKKFVQLEKEKDNNLSTKEKLNLISNEKFSLEQKIDELQKIYKKDEQKYRSLDKEIKVLHDKHFKLSQDIFKQKHEQQILNGEINGSETILKNLSKQIHRLDQETLHKQTLLYNQEYQIQQLERKIRRILGERTDEEKEEFNKRISELSEQLEINNKKCSVLQTQYKHLQDELRKETKTTETLIKDKNIIINEIENLELSNNRATDQLNARVKDKEEVIVDENLLRLELKKLKSYLNARADEVFSLENRQLQLQYALEERNNEINVHKEMLELQIKEAEEERHMANTEYHERLNKLDKLKKRYEILVTHFPNDEEEHSQAYYIIKAAQKREELQKKGDEYDNAIKKAEKEIKALENTLKLMNIKNEQYRQSVSYGEITRKETEQKELLEQQYQAATEKYKEKRQEILDFQEVLAHLEKVIASLAEDEKNNLQNIGFLESKIGNLNKELEEQEQKKKRIYNLTEKLIHDIKKKKGLKKNDFLQEEFEVSLKELKEFYSMIINKIAELIKDEPELKLKVDNEFEQEVGVSLARALSRHSSYNSYKQSNPNSRSSSRANSRVSSRASSRASTRSESKVNSRAESKANSRAESRVDSRVESRVTSRSSSRLSNASKGTEISKVDIKLELSNENKNGSTSSLNKKSNSSLTKKKSTSNTKLNNK
jgi:UDP-glucose:O-linked fucose beta-1,3-glucosyltransferase